MIAGASSVIRPLVVLTFVEEPLLSKCIEIGIESAVIRCIAILAGFNSAEYVIGIRF